jgi:hypothetical protein
MARIQYIGGFLDGAIEEIGGAIPPTIFKLQTVTVPGKQLDGVYVKGRNAVFKYTYTIHNHEGNTYGFRHTETTRTE